MTQKELDNIPFRTDMIDFWSIESLRSNFEEEVKSFAKYCDAKIYIDLDKFLSIEEQRTFVRVFSENMVLPVVHVSFPKIGVWEITPKKVEKKKFWFF